MKTHVIGHVNGMRNYRRCDYMEKKWYYVDMQSREISQTKFDNNHHYKIYASDEEVEQLRRIFDRVYEADREAYWRSHVPFVPYHHDRGNDLYDRSFTEALQLIYELGDADTKRFIESEGILSDRSLDEKRS